MRKEFVMRGKIASGTNEVLNFSGKDKGYAYRMTDFEIYPSETIGISPNIELCASVTAANTFEDPQNPNFDNEGLIAVAFLRNGEAVNYVFGAAKVINDTYLITQDLIIAALDSIAGNPIDVNYQCRFVMEKMTGPEEAATNYKQFTINDA